MNKNDILKGSLDSLAIEYSEEQIHKFNMYYDLLIEWNKKINLTTITEYDEVVRKHFIDSILICSFMDINDKKVIDIGTGAGFPGIPIKILNPGCKIVLLDSLNKRIKFLEEVVTQLDLKDIIPIHGRAEDIAHNKTYRASFDISISRAVSNLSTLSEYCIPFIRKGGYFISYKSNNSDEEIDGAAKAIEILGSKINSIKECTIPGTDIKRRFVIIENIEDIKSKYPRKAGVPAKNPL